MSRGSEWRRWDLHLHTPGTLKCDNYQGNTLEEKWDGFYKTIKEYVGDGKDAQRAVCAIGITDYCSIDNYLKVVEDNLLLPDCIKLILPNVELRIIPIAKKSPVNIHCIFDPSLANNLEDRFFSKLKIENNNVSYSAARGELMRLGRNIKSPKQLSDTEALNEGRKQFVIEPNRLWKVFEEDRELREKTIIVVSNKSGDGVSGVGSGSQMDIVKSTIYQHSDMIFSSNQNDIKYFLGKSPYDPEEVKKRCGSLKPCVHGCDAHSNDKVFDPDEKRYCWIKADLTFEGLKQILYEPEERVRISETIPDWKHKRNIIDRVEIQDDRFSPEPIFFSDKLTCIIGGKSTGKSLLLHNMAVAIDKKEVDDKVQIVGTKPMEIPELKVYWGDTGCSTKENSNRTVIYIPQSYLNRLVDYNDKSEGAKAIDELIKKILLQHRECSEANNVLEQKKNERKQKLSEDLIALQNSILQKNKIAQQCKEIGDKSAIEKEIERLNAKLSDLSNTYNIKETKLVEYQKALDKKQELETKLSSIEKDIQTIKDVPSIIDIDIINLETKGLVCCKQLVEEAISKVKESANKLWLAERDKIVESACSEKEKTKQEIDSNSRDIAQLVPFFEKSQEINRLTSAVAKEKTKLNELSEYLEKLESARKEYSDKLKESSKIFSDYDSIYSEYENSINDYLKKSNFGEDLKFSVKKAIRLKSFSDKLSEIINNKTFSRFNAFNLHEIPQESDLTSANIESLIESILLDSDESLRLKSWCNPESALNSILADWYDIDYMVNMGKEDVRSMSPGGRALVLLRLVICLSNGEYPILIDQPEDDLDNRSVFEDLVRFIKEEKINRQIILVTHNANIVLGADAELVIVANQGGKNAPNEKFLFEYRGGSVEDMTLGYAGDNASKPKGILYQKGMQDHICEILEGGEQAFTLRKHKYHFTRE